NRQSLSPGIRYYWMTQQTKGLFFNICEQDWSPVLQNLGLNVFVPLDTWTLSQAADPSFFDVTVDGIAVVPDPDNGYTYNGATNAVQFHGRAVPPPGQKVSVTSLGNCRPCPGPRSTAGSSSSPGPPPGSATSWPVCSPPARRC